MLVLFHPDTDAHSIKKGLNLDVITTRCTGVGPSCYYLEKRSLLLKFMISRSLTSF